MVGMQIPPPHPLVRRHHAEHGVCRPRPGTPHKALQPPQQPRNVSRKLHRPRPAHKLIHLRRSRNPTRPLHRRPQRQPFVNRQGNRRPLHRSHLPLSQRTSKRIRQMTNHLMTTHRTPHPSIRRSQSRNPTANLCHILHPQKRLHPDVPSPCLTAPSNHHPP
jgi:hypothetical protein